MDAPFTILMPVFNDWASAELLLASLDEACGAADLRPRVLLVDDGSPEDAPPGFGARAYRALARVEVLRLHANLGHQRAICTGLVHLAASGDAAAVVVMDADGEDAPAHVPALVARYRELGGRCAVFAARARRTESALFQAFYRLYRSAHRLLVGADVRIGNFSILPMATVQRLIRSTDLWNHYAAAVVRSRRPMETIPLDRGHRLLGRSQMSFVSLVVHGLSAMAVFGHTVAVRLLMTTVALALLSMGGLAAVVALRLFTDLAIPGWATSAVGLLAILCLQFLLAAAIFSLSLLASRSAQTVVPVRDCPLFIESVRETAAAP